MSATSIVQDARQYAADELLRDGSSIHIRAIAPDDKQRLQEHFNKLSSRSVYFRFFGIKTHLSDAEVQKFTEPDFRDHVGLIATLRREDGEHILGVGRYFRSAAHPERAEVAFAVLDELQGRGIGTILLNHLGRIARASGVSEFEADVLGENNRMLRVFASSGFQVKRSLAGGVVHVSFPTAATPEWSEATLARERGAAAESVRGLIEPGSVALVGASRQPGSIGEVLLNNLKSGFQGPIYPINPAVDEIGGLRCYPAVTAVADPIDLAIIAVPAPHVEKIIADCAAKKVRGVVVITAGFAEISGDGRATELRLRQLVRQSGMRMVGPNCMGVLNTAPSICLNGTFAPIAPPAGNVGMLSQSGALGIAILDAVRRLNIGISSFVSVGNKADVSGNDLLSYWAEDERTKVIVLYLESFGNPRKFARIAPEVSRIKPIVAVKSGRSAAGSRAASSHSAALASLDVAVDALFEQAGVIRTATLEQMFDVTTLLSTQPLPPGRRVGVVTNAGGPGILLADACEAQGLELPSLSEETRSALQQFLPPQAGLSNPVDMIASASAEQYEQTIATVGRDPSVDALVVIYIPVLQRDTAHIPAAIARGAGRVPAEKPVLTVFLSATGSPEVLASGPRRALPSYSFPENAALALSAAERYARWRERPRGKVFELSSFARSAIRAVVDRVLDGATEPVWVAAEDFATILRATGIESATAALAPPDIGAVRIAEQLGYPLVAKAVAPGLLHKSDIGGVLLDLHNSADIEQAVQILDERVRAAGSRLENILLQRQVADGVEALVGVTTDLTFGPLIVAGLGGVLTELLRDVSFRLTPLTDLDASEMLRELRASKLLDGYRGSPAADRAALAEIVQRISALTEIVPELRELDLNPVKVLPRGKGAIVVDGRMRLGK
ncbi:MAG TPA: GNAT family N-acetyltransferase [Terriglobales bacterium]|nr:GNAT family N-acetyltransferase [Terriglobales bacterium]